MTTTLLVLVIIVLASLLGVVSFFALRWAKIIFVLEDDLEETIRVHERTVTVLENIHKTPMYFDSLEVRNAVAEAMEDVKLCQTATQKLIQNFTQRSKQRYVRLEQEIFSGSYGGGQDDSQES